ncbi:hypothetical protein GCM10027321_33410 [Massilia terrae]
MRTVMAWDELVKRLFYRFGGASLSWNVGQADHIAGHPVMRHQVQRRTRPRETGLAAAKHDRVQADPVLVDQA